MGRDRKNENKQEHFTKLVRNMMQTDAWRALSPTAQALYPWIKFEWHGPKANNNGKIKLSVRQAADCLGCSKHLASKAFHDLQAKGFIVQTKAACLGSHGEATSPQYEITEISMPMLEKGQYGRCLYKSWKHGYDFPVHKSAANNPRGCNGNFPHSRKSDDVVIPLRGKAHD